MEKRLSSPGPVTLGFCIVSFTSIGPFFLLNSDPLEELANLWLITARVFVAAAFANPTAVDGGFGFIRCSYFVALLVLERGSCLESPMAQVGR